MAKVTIDGIAVEVADNVNILTAAEAAGIHIPRLCYHPKLSLSGTCRLCLVEVEKMPKLQTACSTTVRDGMVIFTNNDKVRKARTGVIEFLLINHPLDCPVCDQAGECKLQDYAQEYGVGKARFAEDKREYPMVDIGGGLVRNMNRCVHCKRCIRFCAEIAGIEEYGPMNRGGKTSIGIFPGKSLANRYAGSMVDLCPVGALTSRDFRFKARVWNLKPHRSVCPGCSAGCAVTLEVKGNRILRIRPLPLNDSDSWLLCDEGRFGFHFVHAADRITEPVVRSGGSLKSATLEAAINAAAAALKKVIAAHGAQAVAGICGPHATNEDGLAFLRFMTEAVKSNCHDVQLDDEKVDSAASEDFLRRADHAPNRTGLRALGIGADCSGVKIAEKIASGQIKALIAVDVAGIEKKTFSPALKDALAKLECLIVIDILPSIFSDAATVLIPGAAFAEKEGSFTNFTGRVQRIEKAVRPPKDARPEWETLAAVARSMGLDLGYKCAKDVTADAESRILKTAQAG